MATRAVGHSPANVTKHLKGIDFPANKQELVKHAQQTKADQDVINELQKIEERQYGSMADVMKAFGKERAQSAAQKGRPASQARRT